MESGASYPCGERREQERAWTELENGTEWEIVTTEHQYELVSWMDHLLLN